MTPTIDAELSWSRELDLEVLYLGKHAVGRVANQGGKNNKPRWINHLDGIGGMSFWRTEKTVEQARAALRLAVQKWLSAAGLSTPPADDGPMAALEAAEVFLNACNSAWACGEPSHRVETMLNRADELRAALDALPARQARARGT